MEFAVRAALIEQVESDATIVGYFEGEENLGRGAAQMDNALGGQLRYLIKEEKFEGKVGQTTFLHTFGKIPARIVIVAGLGKKAEASADDLRKAAGSAAKRARDLKAERVATSLHQSGLGRVTSSAAAQIVVEGMALATYRFTKYKSDDKAEPGITRVELIESDLLQISAMEETVKRGQIIADAVNLARDLGNEPGGSLTPAAMAEVAQRIAREHGLEFRILDPKEIEALGMGALLGVAKGSTQAPRFVHLVYKPEKESAKRIAIVGKGITFDSGGLDIKTADQMQTMKDDKSGASAVIAAMSALAKLKPGVTVDGLAPLTENMPGGSAMKPGDVLKALNGKTIEVLNTDAEGRLILADALAYAVKQGADEIIDLATLTGACVVALGKALSGIMGTDQRLIDTLVRIGEDQGENLWQLPLVEDYRDQLKSDVADLKNVGGREGGAINAGLFLKEFVEGKSWAHLDIAGTAWADSELPYTPKGATGVGVRTLIAYILGSWAEGGEWSGYLTQESRTVPACAGSSISPETSRQNIAGAELPAEQPINQGTVPSVEVTAPAPSLANLDAWVDTTLPLLKGESANGSPPGATGSITQPDEERAHLLVAETYRLTGNYDKALVEYSFLMNERPSLLLQVIKGLQELVADQPDLLSAHRLLGEAYLKDGLYTNAANEFRWVLSKSREKDEDPEGK